MVVELILLVALGLITSFEDLKIRKIRNKWLLLAIFLFLIFEGVMILMGKLSPKELISSGVMFLLALVISVILWKFKIWSPGDAKLFSTFALLIPQSIYIFTTTPLPFLEILINTLMVAFLYLITRSFIKTRNKLFWIRRGFNLKIIGLYVLSVFALSWISRGIITYTELNYFSVGNPFMVSLILITVMHSIIRKIFGRESIALLAFIALMRVFLNTEYIMTIEFLATFILTTAAFGIILTLINSFNKVHLKRIHIHDLTQGDVINHSISRTGIISRKASKSNIFNESEEGISEKDVKKIKELHLKGKIHFNNLYVHDRIPFAMFLFIGAVLTIIARGNTILFIRNIIGN